jgi:DNA-binding NarL/FixJ family response regulator
MLARLVARAPALPVTPLSSREQEVLELLTSGLQNKQVATRLGISPRTVERHCDSIYAKLGVRTRTEAVVQAISSGLVSASRGKP